jgi:hypothetical protein
MADYLDYPDNLVLHLEREKRSYKIFTTDKRGQFKIINGLWIGDSVIDTKHCNERELKQLFIDNCCNGYEIKTNLVFKQGLFGVAKELAKEREDRLKAAELSSIDNPDDEHIKMIIHEESEEEKASEEKEEVFIKIC